MNLFGPVCPACGGEPISLWQKLGSRPGRSFACQSCGTPLRLGMPGFRQFLLPAIVGTLASFAPGILAGVGIFILAFAVVLPAWPAYPLGETRAFQTRVVHKGGSHRLGTCKTQIRLDTASLFSNWSLCLPEAQWNALKEGDAVVVTSASSWLGDYVLHVVPAAGAAAR